MRVYDKEVYIIFINFKKAYDFIHRPSPINILKEFNFPIKLFSLIKSSLENTSIKIEITVNTASETVRVYTGMIQGDSLLPNFL